MWRRGQRSALIAATVAGLAMFAPQAPADHHDSDIPWPQLLPPQEVTTEVQPQPVRNCRRASIRCVDGLIRRLRRQWRPLHRACDHRAVAAYSYLMITKELRRDLARRQPRFFRYRRWMEYLIVTFSNRYFAAFRDYQRGRPVPDAWRIAFDTAARGDVNAGQDVLLFSNAHVQHDLPYALAEMGLRAPDGASRKPDHDGVNAINSRVFDPIQDFIAANYDESFSWMDMKPLPLDEQALEALKSWREGAWRNAERLLNARSPEERAQIDEQIRANSRFWAERIASFETPGYRAQRDAYCRSRPGR